MHIITRTGCVLPAAQQVTPRLTNARLRQEELWEEVRTATYGLFSTPHGVKNKQGLGRPPPGERVSSVNGPDRPGTCDVL